MASRFVTTKRFVKHLPRRFAVLLPLIIACVLISQAHILAVGSTYDVALPEYTGHTVTEQNIQIDPPTMATIEKTWEDDEGVPHVVFRAGEPGRGLVLISFEDTGGMFELQTTTDGVLVVGGFDVMGWEYICVSLILVISCVGLLCLSAAISLWRRSWFGYRIAMYIGGAIFFIFQAITFAALFLGGSFAAFSDFGGAVTEMANRFVQFAAIPVAAIAIFVALSNVALLRHEGRAFTNLLGVIAAVFWAAVFFGLQATRTALLGLIMSPIVFILLDSALSAVLAYGVALFLGICITALLAARHVPEHPRDYLVILGCGLRDDGTPTPLLAGRVDAALAYAKRQEEAGYAAPTFVPSGGQGSDEVCSEATSMARYIEGKVADARILPEDKSTTTRENMAFSLDIIKADAAGSEPAVAFSTTNYHVLRGYVFAHMVDIDAEGIAAPTKLYFWPNAFLREFVGMLVARAVPIALNCLSIVALYGVLEFLLISR